MPADKHWAVNEAASRVDKFWWLLYPEIAFHLGDNANFRKLAVAHRDLKAALRLAHTPTGDPWAMPSRTTIRIADEPCIAESERKQG
jgi:hypothetical protein